MEQEHRILSDLAEQWFRVRQQLTDIEAAVATNQKHFYVCEDGTIEVNFLECV
jgi:hypothetical protein